VRVAAVRPLLACVLLRGACGVEADTPAPPVEPVPIDVMTFNVLCSFCGAEGFDPWAARVEMIADVFARHDPDLLGLQELSFPPEIDQLLPQGYRALWFADQDEHGQARHFPDSTLFWRASRFEEREHGFFWLSPTPETAFSVGFASPQLPRVVAWVVLEDLEHGGELVFVTTHFDPNSPSQALSAPLFLERLEALAQGRPLVVTGDFNSEPDDEAYETLVGGADGGDLRLTDAWEVAADKRVLGHEPPHAPYPPETRIDHVFMDAVEGRWEVERWRADLTRYGEDERLPSDHRALSAGLLLHPGS